MNEKGLAAALTFLYPHIRKPGLNAGMLIRYILEKCATTEEAIEALKNLPIASAQTITLADRNGKIAVVECNPVKLEVIRPELGAHFVAAANCFHSEAMKKYRTPPDVDSWRAEERYETVRNALAEHGGAGSLGFCEDVLSGKHGFICQYDRKTNADTVWSAVYDVKNLRFYRVEGNPSRKPFKLDTRMKF
jgi:predicted choloylglycine hydrolase